MVEEPELIQVYLSLWKNRTINERSERSLIQLIDDELNDLRTHPRLRKTRFEKYFQSIRRITNSTLEQDIKLKLIELHTERLHVLINAESRE
ncbi:hypothetical protein PJ311_14500 [Bacillus sp. CLL-7-23]|uniref:YojE n=1 Tax=Bacillus changyiensis TaxID=3004103 RepID=A0ABT4X6E9_9BACI|nr:hypothetical protein [Bacillus changyiensis]MDA7027788.1 hypothetical protein [Bacillus changyiensis]